MLSSLLVCFPGTRGLFSPLESGIYLIIFVVLYCIVSDVSMGLTKEDPSLYDLSLPCCRTTYLPSFHVYVSVY